MTAEVVDFPDGKTRVRRSDARLSVCLGKPTMKRLVERADAEGHTPSSYARKVIAAALTSDEEKLKSVQRQLSADADADGA